MHLAAVGCEHVHTVMRATIQKHAFSLLKAQSLLD